MLDHHKLRIPAQTAPRRSTGDMQEYLDRMKTVLAEIEAEQVDEVSHLLSGTLCPWGS